MKVFWEFRHVISVFYIIFRRGAPQGGLSCPFGAIHLLYVAKNSSHGATCGKGPAPVGPDPFRAKAEREAPPAVPEGPRPSCRHAARGSLAQMFLGTFGRNPVSR